MGPATVLANELFERLRGEHPYDLSAQPASASEIYYDTRKHPPSELKRFHSLRGLMSSPSSVEAMDTILQVSSLETLVLTGVGPNKELPKVWKLPKLRELALLSVQNVTTLEPLTQLKSLKRLSVIGTVRLTDYSPLAQLTQLEELEIGLETHTQKCGIDSLEFVRSLESLRVLRLIINKPAAGATLDPIASLRNLKSFWFICNAFPAEQIARLAVRMPKTNCEFFAGHGRFVDCFRCKAKDSMALIAGKGGGMLCRACQKDRFDKKLAKFNTLLDREREEWEGGGRR